MDSFWKSRMRNNFVGLGQLTVTEFTVGTVALSSHMAANRKFHQEKQLL